MAARLVPEAHAVLRRRHVRWRNVEELEARALRCKEGHRGQACISSHRTERSGHVGRRPSTAEDGHLDLRGPWRNRGGEHRRHRSQPLVLVVDLGPHRLGGDRRDQSAMRNIGAVPGSVEHNVISTWAAPIGSNRQLTKERTRLLNISRHRFHWIPSPTSTSQVSLVCARSNSKQSSARGGHLVKSTRCPNAMAVTATSPWPTAWSRGSGWTRASRSRIRCHRPLMTLRGAISDPRLGSNWHFLLAVPALPSSNEEGVVDGPWIERRRRSA